MQVHLKYYELYLARMTQWPYILCFKELLAQEKCFLGLKVKVSCLFGKLCPEMGCKLDRLPFSCKPAPWELGLGTYCAIIYLTIHTRFYQRLRLRFLFLTKPEGFCNIPLLFLGSESYYDIFLFDGWNKMERNIKNV